MKNLLSLITLSTLILFATSCASSTSRDVASESKKCKEVSVPDHSSYYDTYEECNDL